MRGLYNTNSSLVFRTWRSNFQTYLSSATTSIIPTIDLFQKPIDQWNKADIIIWFQQNKILPEICTLYDFEDGNELLMYVPSVSTDEKSKYEYQICSQAYSQANNGKILMTHKFARFVNVLKRIYDKNENVKPTASITTHNT